MFWFSVMQMRSMSLGSIALEIHKPHSKSTAVTEIIEELPKMSRSSAIVPPEEPPFLGWYIGP